MEAIADLDDVLASIDDDPVDPASLHRRAAAVNAYEACPEVWPIIDIEDAMVATWKWECRVAAPESLELRRFYQYYRHVRSLVQHNDRLLLDASTMEKTHRFLMPSLDSGQAGSPLPTETVTKLNEEHKSFQVASEAPLERIALWHRHILMANPFPVGARRLVLALTLQLMLDAGLRGALLIPLNKWLKEIQHDAEPGSDQSAVGTQRWVETFLHAVRAAYQEAAEPYQATPGPSWEPSKPARFILDYIARTRAKEFTSRELLDAGPYSSVAPLCRALRELEVEHGILERVGGRGRSRYYRVLGPAQEDEAHGQRGMR